MASIFRPVSMKVSPLERLLPDEENSTVSAPRDSTPSAPPGGAPRDWVGTGSGENVVTTRELVTRMGKLKKELTKQEVAAVDKRLRALGKVRPPVPQGIDPQRMRSMGRGQRR